MSVAREVDANRGESTSPGLSSPPSPNSPTRQTATATAAGHSYTNNRNDAASLQENAQIEGNDGGGGGGVKSLNSMGAKNAAAPPRRPRKKKDPESKPTSSNNHSHHHHHHHHNNDNASTATATDGQEQRPKKTRAARGTSEQYKRRQQKQLQQQQAAREAEALQVSRQLKISHSLSPKSPAVHPQHQNGNSEAIPTQKIPTHQNILPTTRPLSGQNYDPIRSSTVAPRPSSPLATPPTPQRPYKFPSATASPSIHSMIEQTSASPLYSYPQPPKRDIDTKAASPSEPKRPRLSPPLPVTTQQPARPSPRDIAPAISNTSTSNTINIMDIDTDKPSAPVNKTTYNVKKPSPNASTAVSSSSHSPKPSRPRETQVAISSGSGLLSGSIFGGGIDSTAPEKTAPTVVLNVPLTGDNQYVNFTRLAEERYGFNALHPRLAAQRERLARVAAAGAALENATKSGGNSGSGDEMSVDLSDGEADNSNVEMGGVNDGERIQKSGEETGEAGVAKKPRKRTMKEDMYDKEDDFIDDTEMIWEEQAAASKDGFFVYSGPLVPPGQEPQVERADGLPKRGRGTGRGRGGAIRGAARAAANPKDGVKVPGRKPRVTKAAKEQMEREKAQRENSLAVLASKPALTPAPA
ncbi:MAG: hypothetical protein ALECFALPRED_002370 [Alectoria fallacina]|uniref:Hpc2-related domain-containing protein n=1 Tax=Alectoria fallacina TaxID=1903189 RepID=A0A8H3FGS1_9LECA|nr:MAG: hypothetical protein ALECFALPRED_002370 [Alectoria fallacina]